MAEPGSRPASGWALGGLTFAASLMVLAGAFQFVAGLAAVLDDQFYVVTRNYTFDLDVTAWGWIHMIVGGVVFFAGISLFSRKGWAAGVALALALLSALVNFFFLPYYPFWAIIIIAIDLWIIWALTRPGVIDD